jgi:hypothetical protein
LSGTRVRVGSKRVIDQRSGGADDYPQTYGVGRRCGAEGCETVLSKYNPSDVCAVHTIVQAEPARRRTPRRTCEPTSGTCQLEGRGRAFVTTSRTRKYCSDRCRVKAFALRKLPTFAPACCAQ